MLEIIELEISNHHKQGLWRRSRAFHTLKVKLAPLLSTLTLTASLISWRLEMRAKDFVVNRGVSCFIRGVSCFIRGVSCFIRGVSCFIRCILSCFIRCNPVFQSWSSRRERVNEFLDKILGPTSVHIRCVESNSSSLKAYHVVKPLT